MPLFSTWDPSSRSSMGLKSLQSWWITSPEQRETFQFLFNPLTLLVGVEDSDLSMYCAQLPRSELACQLKLEAVLLTVGAAKWPQPK